MALDTGNSLFWKTGLDNTALRAGAQNAVGIISNMAVSITRINPFAVIGIFATAAFTKASIEATQFSIKVNEAMKEVETISKATHANFQGITDAIIDMSTRVPEAGDQLAKAYYQVVSAGYDGAAGLQLLETASRAATAGVTDTFTAVDGLTTVLNAFKIKAEDAEYAADVLFTTVRLGKTTFPELAQNMSYVAPIAAANGIAFEQIAAAVATLTKQGMDTTMAMRYLRGAIIQMNDVLGDGWTKTMTLQEGMQQIFDLAGGSPVKMRELVGSVEALNAILALTGDNAAEAAKDLKEYDDALGATADAYEIMQDKVSVQSQLFANKMTKIFAPIGDAIQEFIIDRFKEANSLLDTLIQHQQEIADKYNQSKLKAIEKIVTNPPQKFDTSGSAIAGGIPTMESMSLKERMDAINLSGVVIEGLAFKLRDYDSAAGDAEKQQSILNDILEEARKQLLGTSEDAETAANSVRELNDALAGDANDKPYKAERELLWGPKKQADIDRLVDREKRNAAPQGLPPEFTRDQEWQQNYAIEMQQIADEEIAKNRKIAFDKLFQDTRRMNERELKEYETFLKEKAALDEYNADEKIAIIEKLDQVQQQIYDREIEKIKDIGNAIDEFGNLISRYDAEFGQLSKDVGSVIASISNMEQTTTGWGEAAGLLQIAGAVDKWADKLSKYLVKAKETTRGDDPMSLYWKGWDQFTVAQKEFQIGITYGEERLRRMKELLVYLEGRLTEDWKDLKPIDRIRAEQDIEDQKRRLQEYITGTTPETLADAISDGFEKGLSSAKVFADTFEDLMRGAMLNSFKQQILATYMQPFLNEFQRFLDSNGLSDEETIILQDTLQMITEQSKSLYDEIVGTGLFDSGGADARGLTGQIKQSITEDTANIIEGQLLGMRMNMIDMLDVMERQFNRLDRIADNTDFNRRYLPQMSDYLGRIANSGTSVRAIGG